jgi:hypothetical protein
MMPFRVSPGGRNDVVGSSTVSLGGIGNPLVTRLGAIGGAPAVGGLVLIGFTQPPAAPADVSVSQALMEAGLNPGYRTGVSPTAHAVWLYDRKDEPLLGSDFAEAIEKVRKIAGVKYVKAVDVFSTPAQLEALDKQFSGETPKWLWALGGVFAAGVVLTLFGLNRK